MQGYQWISLLLALYNHLKFSELNFSKKYIKNIYICLVMSLIICCKMLSLCTYNSYLDIYAARMLLLDSKCLLYSIYVLLLVS